jgi:hypothetical protein
MKTIFPINENLIKQLSDDLNLVIEEAVEEAVEVHADKPSVEK